MSDNEDGQNNPQNMLERISSILGPKYLDFIDNINYEMERLTDMKPAMLFDYGDVSIEKLERFFPAGFSITEIGGRKMIVNMEVLDRRTPWHSSIQALQYPSPNGHGPPRRPIFIDISPGRSAPRIMNWDDLPDTPLDLMPSASLVYMVSDICAMMKSIRDSISDGERVIEKSAEWENQWCSFTILQCLLGLPVVFWSDTSNGKYCIDHNTPGWLIEWVDGETHMTVYKFWVPESLFNNHMRKHLQHWIDRLFDRSLPPPHQNFFMMQRPAPAGEFVFLSGSNHIYL